MANWQDGLWIAINYMGRWIDWPVAVLGLIGAVIMFVRFIMQRKTDALLVSRAMRGIGLMLIGFSPCNSGLYKPGVDFLVIGCVMGVILYEADWAKVRAWLLALPRTVMHLERKARHAD